MSHARTIPAPAGNPDALERAVDGYAVTEAALAQAAADIASSLAEGVGQAIDALHGRSHHAREVLEAAHGRYEGTRAALRDYTVELRSYHEAVNAAGDRGENAQYAHSRAEADVAEARHELRVASMNPDDVVTIDYWDDHLRRARRERDAAEAEVSAAWGDYQRAVDRLDTAAQEAIARIQDSFSETNDSWRDRLGELVDGVMGMLSALAEWVEDFFKEVFQLIVDAVELFLTAVLIALVVIALIAVIIAAVALALVLIAVALAVIVLVIAEALVLLGVLVGSLRAADLLGLDGLARIRFVVAALALACPPLGWFILSRIENELSKPPLQVDELDPNTLSPEERATLAQIDFDYPEDAADILAWGGYVDGVGGSDQAVVDIAKVTDENGNVSWIVTLPSTMDWVVGGDKGAPNDLDADLMLVLFPELRSQYEAAVLEAMKQAGIGEGEPVVLSGWSLGGIMAGSLVESGAGGYDYAGIIAAGSPIDHMAIPDDVPVLQVKHTLDPVHRLDMVDSVADTSNHIAVWDGPGSGGKSPEIQTGNLVGHHNGDYVETLRSHLDYNATHSGPNLSEDFYIVMPYDDPSTPQGVTVEHTQYAFAE